MTLFKNKYRIESTRLKDWDYSSAGFYFVTICVKERECYLGEVVTGEMHLSSIGEIANQFWIEIPQHSRAKVELDAYVIMPNHMHGTIVIDEPVVAGRDVACNVSTSNSDPISAAMSKISPKSGSLGAIVRSYKSAVTRWCRMNRHPFFNWQERYFDEIIWNEQELDNVRTYIENNPANWENDVDNLPGLWM